MKTIAQLQRLTAVCRHRVATKHRTFAFLQTAAAVREDASTVSELPAKASSRQSLQDPKSVASKPLDGFKVPQGKDPRQLAAKIAQNTRKGIDLSLLCLGATSINVAVKSIAISRIMLKENGGVDVSFQPELRHDVNITDDKTAYKLRINLSSGQGSFAPSTAVDEVLMVGSKSKSGLVAGALAHRIREGRSVALRSIGAGAVAKALLAACKTRSYLENEQKDIRLVPEFTKVQTEARGETVACCLWVLVEGKQGQGQALRQQTTEPQQASSQGSAQQAEAQGQQPQQAPTPTQ